MITDFTEFISYAYIPGTSNYFDRHGSIWTVFMVNERGDRIDPLELRRIEPITPVITEYFPYINPYYGMTYRLHFPSLNTSGGDNYSLRLVFASVRDRRGRTEIRRTLTNLPGRKRVIQV